MDVSLSELQELVMDREAWRAAIHGVAKSRTWPEKMLGMISIFLNLPRLVLWPRMHDTGCLGLVHWDDPEGWCGEG